jgi:signal transduction histidine kinase
LSWDSELGSSFGGQVVFPMLFECDHVGRVLWMSRGTRVILRDPKQLIDILAVKTLTHPVDGLAVSTPGLWHIFKFRDTVLIGLVGRSAIPEAQDLNSLHRSMAVNFFRLLKVERRLYERTRRRRGAGKSAVRQIELERQRLGRELHTGVGQMLAAIRWQLEVISTALPEPTANVAHALESIATLAEQALEQVRSVSRRLHPPEWQRLTLESAIRQLWEISGIPQRLTATLQIDPLPREPNLEVKVLLYRALQEALSNVARHSQATRIAVRLAVTDSVLTLSIRDNGVGFNLEKTIAAPPNLISGIGLRSIRETAESLGGKFQVESGPYGTTLVISAALAIGSLENSKE